MEKVMVYVFCTFEVLDTILVIFIIAYCEYWCLESIREWHEILAGLFGRGSDISSYRILERKIISILISDFEIGWVKTQNSEFILIIDIILYIIAFK